MTKKETAEQKLLKIIEAQGSASKESPSPAPAQIIPQPTVAQEVASSVKSSGLPPVSIPPLVSSLLNLFKGGFSVKNSALSIGLKEINNFFVAVIVLIVVLMALTVFSGVALLKHKMNFKISASALKMSENFVPAMADIAQYLENIKRRNIFNNMITP